MGGFGELIFSSALPFPAPTRQQICPESDGEVMGTRPGGGPEALPVNSGISMGQSRIPRICNPVPYRPVRS